jgi:serine phosphatase RsbU (regulator of sigma subunit)
LLPSDYPQVPPAEIDNPLSIRFAHLYQPASTVGGDFFDLLELDENRVAVLIADVMGHGARSALVTAILRAQVRNYSAATTDPGGFLGELNRHLHEVIAHSGQTLFVTAFFMILDTRTGMAGWAVAGHPSPLRVRRGGDLVPAALWERSRHQPALGLLPDVIYRSIESPMREGDVFLLFTDGVVEAERPDGTPFGLDRLKASFAAALDGPMAAIPATIVSQVSDFQKRSHYDDDVCIVVVEVAANSRRAAAAHVDSSVAHIPRGA